MRFDLQLCSSKRLLIVFKGINLLSSKDVVYYPGVDGGFSRWGFWSECSVSCGLGTQTRNRTCTHPPPHGPYGADCDGPLQETRACNEGPCHK